MYLTVNMWVNNYKETSGKRGGGESYFEKYSDPNKYSLIQKLRLREESITVLKKKKNHQGEGTVHAHVEGKSP